MVCQWCGAKFSMQKIQLVNLPKVKFSCGVHHIKNAWKIMDKNLKKIYGDRD